MGWFLGHSLPGTAWILYGLLRWLQSLNRVRSLTPLRTQPRYILLFPFLIILYGFGGILVEVFDDWRHWRVGAGNWGHVLMLFSLGTSGLIELFHVMQVSREFSPRRLTSDLLKIQILVEPMWSVVGPIGILFMAFMLSVHSQPVLFWTYLHLVSGVIILPLVLSAIMRNMYKVPDVTGFKKSRDTTVFDDDARHDAPTSCCGLCKSRKTEELNPIYTLPGVYETPYPGLIAFFSILNGLWWWEMAMQMGMYGMENLPTGTAAHEGHELHAIMVLLMKHLLITTGFLVLVSAIARRYGDYQPPQRFDDSLQL